MEQKHFTFFIRGNTLLKIYIFYRFNRFKVGFVYPFY